MIFGRFPTGLNEKIRFHFRIRLMPTSDLMLFGGADEESYLRSEKISDAGTEISYNLEYEVGYDLVFMHPPCWGFISNASYGRVNTYIIIGDLFVEMDALFNLMTK